MMFDDFFTVEKFARDRQLMISGDFEKIHLSEMIHPERNVQGGLFQFVKPGLVSLGALLMTVGTGLKRRSQPETTPCSACQCKTC